MSERMNVNYLTWATVCRDIVNHPNSSAHNSEELKVYNILSKTYVSPFEPAGTSSLVELECVAEDCSCDLRISVSLPPNRMCLLPIPAGFDFVRGELDLSNLEIVDERKSYLH